MNFVLLKTQSYIELNMNIVIEHTQCCRSDWRGGQERQMGRFFGLSFLFHLCCATIFAFLSDLCLSRIRKNDIGKYKEPNKVCPVSMKKHSAAVWPPCAQPSERDIAPPY